MSPRSARNLAAAFFLALLPAPLHASVAFSEIMYDLPGSDEGREWVEVVNQGNAPVDLAGWRFIEGGVKHKLKTENGTVLASGAYAVIADDAARFRKEWPGFSGLLIESAFSLRNDGESIALMDASSTPLASAAFSSGDGAKGDGNTLNSIAGIWSPRSPTPGALASTSAIPPPEPPRAPEPALKRNLGTPAAVRTIRVPVPAVSETAAAEAALDDSAAPARTPASGAFAILPWIAGLILVSVGGISVILMGRRSGSGYQITEEEP